VPVGTGRAPRGGEELGRLHGLCDLWSPMQRTRNVRHRDHQDWRRCVGA